MRRYVTTLMMIFIGTASFAGELQWAPNEVLVKLSQSVLLESDGSGYLLSNSADQALLQAGCTTFEPVFQTPQLKRNELDRWMSLTCKPGVSEETLLENVQKLEFIEESSLNYMVYLDEMPNDPDYSKQYAWDLLHAEAAWDITHGSTDVIVAVIDSGTDLDHEDLVDAIWTNTAEIPGNSIDDDGNGYVDDTIGWDFAQDDNDPDNVNADNLHGTHVAGIIGAVSNNSIGVAGGTWGCPLMILKVFPNAGGGAYVDDVAEAIRYATDNGAAVMNLSLGGAGNAPIQADAVLYAYNSGSVVVAAAGNGGNDGMGDTTPHYPSGNEGAIGVGSINKFQQKDGSSNYNEEWVDIFAPGVAIRSTLPNDAYKNLSGTSMASPVSAALAALIISNNPGITPEQVELRMEAGCENIDLYNPTLHGLLDPGRIDYLYSLAETPILRVDKWVVNDASGNSNNEADQGETVSLQLYLQNKSWMDATNVTATISAASGVTITSDASSYGSMASKEIQVNTTAFELTVTEAAKTVIPITVNITADGGYEDTLYFDLSVNNPFPQLTGFPVASFGGFNASPRVADLNQDGVNEIITASNDGTVYVLNQDGSNFPGWPINLVGTQPIDDILILAPPAIADMDMDGDLEIIIADQFADAELNNPHDPGQGTKVRYIGRVHVFNYDGTYLPGNWPFITGTPFTDPPTQKGFKSGPTIADIAGDDHYEIVIGNYGDTVFAFDYTGTAVPGWPRNVGTDVFASAAAFDYNKDGKDEIVIAVKDDKEPLDSGALYLFNGDGSIMPAFPIPWDNQIYSVPVLADMNKDNIPEIIFGWGDYSNAVPSKGLTVLDIRSQPLPGWPVSLPDSIYASPGLGDLDNDGNLEIVVCSVAADVYAFHLDGTPVSGFPVSISEDPDAVINSSPAIADINNDGSPEIIFCMEIGFHTSASLHILNSDGTPMENTPITLDSSGFSSPCVVDLDKDGDLEILITDMNTSVFNLNTDFDADMQYWTTYHSNNLNNGLYGGTTPLETGVNLMITDTMFTEGKAFSLDAVLVNAEATPYQDVDLYVLLDVYSMYWFYPTWSETADWLDINILPPGDTLKNVISFKWPEVGGSAENLMFWGGLIDDQFELLGNIDFVEFGYTD